MASVRLEHVTKRFGGVEAVNDLTLDVPDGGFVCLLGPSGCGKTTTLRMIAGLETPDSGDVYIGDKRVNDIPARDRDVGMVFQFYAIYPGMTTYDHLAFPLEQKKLAKPEIKSRVKRVAEMLGLDDVLDRVAMELSVDQKQRVALGRAIAKEPQVYLLDEPLSNLDAALRVRMTTELKRLWKDLKATFVFVTHDQLEGMRLADRIAVMEKGVLQQFDTPDSVYGRPANQFIGGFIGTPAMNFLPCKYVEKERKAFVSGHGFNIDVSSHRDSMHKAGEEEVVVGIRPADTPVSRKPSSPDDARVTTTIVEPTGENMMVVLELNGSQLKAIVPREFAPVRGEQLWLSLNLAKVSIFSKTTGKALLYL